MTLKDILPGRLGFGAAPLGNMFRDIPEQEAVATVNAAWDEGIRYFDTAPFYGAGLAEIRIGAALAGRPRDNYVISTKVGRLIMDDTEDVSARDLGEKGGVFRYGRSNKIVNDYSSDATLRSIEESLKRLGTDHVDIAFVHDVAQDFYGDEWLAVFESARKGAFKALDRLRDEGVVKAWGLWRQPGRADRIAARAGRSAPRRLPARRPLYASRPCPSASAGDADGCGA